ncbi:MAG: hypothetical protein WC742_15445 [Gallionellaceae bacterium]|jgi:hypothetical protein
MAKHTAGFWYVRNRRDGVVYEGEDAPHTIAADGGKLIARIAMQGGGESAANALLIATAPELLSVCKWVAQEIAWGHDMNTSFTILQRVIYKAEEN